MRNERAGQCLVSGGGGYMERGGRRQARPALIDVRLGQDALELTDDRGHALLLHAHGLNRDEQLRTWERILALLRPLVERAT